MTLKKFIYAVLSLLLSTTAIAQVEVRDLLVDNKVSPLGICEMYPGLSWQLRSARRNVTQSAYDIRVSEDIESLKKGVNLVLNTGKTFSDQSVNVKFSGNTLKPGCKYYWQVRVWDNNDRASKWSEPASWVMGIAGPENWQAKWIQSSLREPETRPSPLFRKEFANDKKVKLAIAFITARGMYEAEINGQRVGDLCFTPGWTSYGKRIQYQTYDVTDLLRDGKNAIGVTLGNGWYRSNIGFRGQKDFYGKELALLFQMRILYEDGTESTIISDGSWKTAFGPVQYSEVYHGEMYDARLEQPGWSIPGFNDAEWGEVTIRDYPVINLVSTENEPMRKKEVFKPVRIFTTPKGEKIVDFGQNLVGWVQVKASGNPGDKITIGHAEVLDKEGNFYTINLRAAKQVTSYTLKGGGMEVFEPHFTWQGFRYAKVEGYPGELNPDNFTAIALYSDMVPTGSFSCSDDLINKLQSNIQWSQRDNFLDVPTDCPQRDERLGWTGDAQVFASTAGFNFRVHSFFKKWLKDLALDQHDSGSVPDVVPDVLRSGNCSPGWGDAAVIVPWTMYRLYDDLSILENQYESMKAWVDYIRSVSVNDIWKPRNSYGDWLFFRPADDNDGRSAVTDKSLIAQCFYANAVQLLIQTSELLGFDRQVEEYTTLLGRVKAAFMNEFATSSGRLVSGTQTAYVLALNFNMLPDSLMNQAATRLVENIRSYGTHLTTGFLGTPYLCHVLTRFGYTDVAYELLMRKSYPSWLYPVSMGATTIWERWDGIKPDGTFQTPGMNSFNHYAYGAIGDWMYSTVTGINADKPGYKTIRIKPHITDRLTHAGAELQTYYGKIVSAWNNSDGQLAMNVEIPVNTTAIVYIPATDPAKVKENNRPISSNKDMQLQGTEDGYVVVALGSGSYNFTVAR